MAVSTEELAGGITKVTLAGRLDLQGSALVDSEMHAIAATRTAVLVDMQKVSFLGSVGLRALMVPARAIKNRGGKMVLLAPNEMVEKVLKTSGADALVPVHHELKSALAALRES